MAEMLAETNICLSKYMIEMKGTEVPNPRRSSACDSGMRTLRQTGRANQGRGGRSHVGGGRHC